MNLDKRHMKVFVTIFAYNFLYVKSLKIVKMTHFEHLTTRLMLC